MLHRKPYGGNPPETVAFTVPLAAEQVAFVDVAVAVGLTALDTMALVDAVHPFASVTVTTYTPATRPPMFCAVAPLLQVKVNGAVPPLTESVTVPFGVAHAAAVVDVDNSGAGSLRMRVDALTVHPFDAVTVSE